MNPTITSAAARRRARGDGRALVLGMVLAACGGAGGGDDAAGDGDGSGPAPDAAGDAATSDDWRELLDRPLATTPPALTAVTHGLAPTGLWGEVSGPRPTNRWWQNLVLGSGEQPVNVLPYLVKALPQRLSVSLPARTVAPTYVIATHLDNLSLGAAEPFTSRALAGHDDLSVTMGWRGAGGASMSAPLVRGMAYATMLYAAATPRLSSQHAILTVNGAAAGPFRGRRFDLALDNGQRWLVYASAELELDRAGDGLTARAPFSGSVRAALDPGGAAAILDAHAAAIPSGGRVAAQARGDEARLIFDWQVTGAGEPLLFALPHHRQTLDAPTAAAIALPTIKGEMTGVVGARWTLREPLPTITWSAPRRIAADRRAAVADALRADRERTPVAADPYFFGKQAAAMARLALIADELGDADTAAHVRGNLAAALAPWLAPATPRLAYDRTWGGIVAAGAERDPGAAFGQGYYNDHHFHYGYFLYAAAALAHADPAWAATSGAAVLALARDIANPHADDPSFSVMRHKDWFDGHSWAAGLFEFGDSRNQESSSEAVNAWYGLALWGEATGDARLRDLGRLLLATELRATHTYWQITAASDLYGPPFSAHKVVGVLWATKVDYATFFGGHAEYIHGIQMLPFTPITELLLPAAWIAEEYPIVAAALTRPQPPIADGWRGFIYMAHAILDPAAAWNEAATLGDFDDGNSRTNTLYWIATRP